MQELYYVYKTRNGNGFNLIADRGRRLSDIEVDVSIAHQENCPLGSIAWHKVVVNPLEGQISKNLDEHAADRGDANDHANAGHHADGLANAPVRSNKGRRPRKYSQIAAKAEKEAKGDMPQGEDLRQNGQASQGNLREKGAKAAARSYVLTESALRWNSILLIGGLSM